MVCYFFFLKKSYLQCYQKSFNIQAGSQTAAEVEPPDMMRSASLRSLLCRLCRLCLAEDGQSAQRRRNPLGPISSAMRSMAPPPAGPTRRDHEARLGWTRIDFLSAAGRSLECLHSQPARWDGEAPRGPAAALAWRYAGATPTPTPHPSHILEPPAGTL